eukprot:438456-Amphidinium_carterae.1
MHPRNISPSDALTCLACQCPKGGPEITMVLLLLLHFMCLLTMAARAVYKELLSPNAMVKSMTTMYDHNVI